MTSNSEYQATPVELLGSSPHSILHLRHNGDFLGRAAMAPAFPLRPAGGGSFFLHSCFTYVSVDT